jgi:putative phosphoribosyl transferase
VILVDEGMAGAGIMHAAVAAVGSRGPAEVVVAVPVAHPDASADLCRHADRVVCLSRADRQPAGG